jgi:hypothetical protein
LRFRVSFDRVDASLTPQSERSNMGQNKTLGLILVSKNSFWNINFVSALDDTAGLLGAVFPSSVVRNRTSNV